MNRRALCGTILGVILAGASPVAAEGPAYEIVMHRPAHSGDRYRVESTGRQTGTQKVMSAGKVLKDENLDMAVTLAAQCTVLEIDAKGSASKVMFTIERSSLERGTGSLPFYAAGTLVVASTGPDGEVFTISGRRVSPDLAKALDLVISLSSGEVTDDEVFGTKGTKRVGESWPMNAALAAKSFTDAGIKVEERDVSGKTTLKGTKQAAGMTFLEFESRVDVRNARFPLPDGFRVVDSRLGITSTAIYPTRRDIDVVRESTTLDMTFRAVGRPDEESPEMSLELKATRTASTKYFYR